MQKLKNFKFWIGVLAFGIWILNLNGCSTTPNAPEALPTFSLNGTSYVSLSSLCDLRGISMDYDTISRRISLKKDTQEIDLMVGSSLVLVNGTSNDLGFPVDIQSGNILVPHNFKTNITDALFREIPPTPAARCILPSKIKRIVIDAGHGGKDPGAIGRSGLREKDVVLDIAKRLARQLEAEGKTVYLTRDNDEFIPLATRAQIANKKNADIFISIHANANRARSMSGLEVYYLSPSTNDANCALVAAENDSPHVQGAVFGSRSQNLKAVVWDMIYTDNRSESVELANKICKSVSQNMGLSVLGVKGAPYYVLKWTQMPAVLVETGFISNAGEERMFKNSFYRQQLAEAIAQGINDYCQDFTIAKDVKR